MDQFTFEQQLFQFDKTNTSWNLALKRSDIKTHDLQALSMLKLHHPEFLELGMTMDEDSVHFHYQLPEKGLSFEECRNMSLSEKLRLALNVLDLERVLKLPVTVILHPYNLFITKNSQPMIAYRALEKVMVPDVLTTSDFIKQFKCYLVSLMTSNDFSDLYKGSLEVVKLPEFLETVKALDDVEDIRAFLISEYEKQKEREVRSLSLVSKTRHKIYKFATIWLSALSVILMVPLIYFVFIQNPLNTKLLDADTAFIKNNFSNVIDKLSNVPLDKLPYTQKYELAYSYIQGLNFSKEQEAVILNNVTLKTEELYFDFWIQSGRGENDDAIDISKRLESTDLIIYALEQKIEEVKSDSNLSGEERQTQLKDLQSEIDTYWEDRTERLEQKEDTTDEETVEEK
ncbi:type VII secretion protein EssB [Streptococcus thoraltensis]|uniref:type VII secretion protein EssB n=1 Tax=Streptococcus thoraltensis TaxID=55085 RepID=UPI00035D55FE|nr:type VII secretion protein EssB [Streptococcus thoraltensis]